MASICNDCRIGKQHLANNEALKITKVITKVEFIRRETALGETCFVCIHNGIRGMKARAMKKVRIDFQSLDMCDTVNP